MRFFAASALPAGLLVILAGGSAVADTPFRTPPPVPAAAVESDLRGMLRIHGTPGDFERIYRIGISGDTASKSPAKPRAHAAFGQALMEAGRYEDALEQYRIVYQMSFRRDLPAHEAEMARLIAQVNTNRILELTGRFHESEMLLRTAWLETPGFPGFAISLIRYDLERNRPDEALAIATDGINGLAIYPQTAEMFAGPLYFNRGAVYQFLGNCRAASADYAVSQQYPDVPQPPICKEN